MERTILVHFVALITSLKTENEIISNFNFKHREELMEEFQNFHFYPKTNRSKGGQNKERDRH